MHRSGTTLLSRLLSELGVHMGDKKERNQESTCFQYVNEQMLRATGGSWLNPLPFIEALNDPSFVRDMVALARTELDRRMSEYGRVGKGQLWGWKDPRTTLTLPIWLELFPDARVIHMRRNGIDVALSLRRRAWRQFLRPMRSDIERLFPVGALLRGFGLWKLYHRQALTYTDLLGERILDLHYETLVSTASEQIYLISGFLGILGELEHGVVATAESLVHVPNKRTLFERFLLSVLSRAKLLAEPTDAALISSHSRGKLVSGTD